MSLEISKLEKVRELGDGIVQARCPACAEGGNDRTGEHLRIYPDGRFGCCVHSKDGAHRKKIFALVGDRTPGTYTVRFTIAPPLAAKRSVKSDLTTFNSGTLGTGKTESVSNPTVNPTPPEDNLGTLGTPNFNPRAYRKNSLHIYKDLETAVPSVPALLVPVVAGERLPYLTSGGTLVIPFDSPECCHWWRGGQAVALTRSELETANIQPSTPNIESRGKEKHAVSV